MIATFCWLTDHTGCCKRNIKPQRCSTGSLHAPATDYTTDANNQRWCMAHLSSATRTPGARTPGAFLHLFIQPVHPSVAYPSAIVTTGVNTHYVLAFNCPIHISKHCTVHIKILTSKFCTVHQRLILHCTLSKTHWMHDSEKDSCMCTADHSNPYWLYPACMSYWLHA